MDLSSIDIKETAWLTLKDPAGNDLDWEIELWGVDSEAYEKATRTRGEITQRNIDICIQCTKDWRGVKKDGKDYPCTPQTKKEVFEDRRFGFIRDQVVLFVFNRENYWGN